MCHGVLEIFNVDFSYIFGQWLLHTRLVLNFEKFILLPIDVSKNCRMRAISVDPDQTEASGFTLFGQVACLSNTLHIYGICCVLETMKNKNKFDLAILEHLGIFVSL